jgi:hypothetical protein
MVKSKILDLRKIFLVWKQLQYLNLNHVVTWPSFSQGFFFILESYVQYFYVMVSLISLGCAN